MLAAGRRSDTDTNEQAVCDASANTLCESSKHRACMGWSTWCVSTGELQKSGVACAARAHHGAHRGSTRATESGRARDGRWLRGSMGYCCTSDVQYVRTGVRNQLIKIEYTACRGQHELVACIGHRVPAAHAWCEKPGCCGARTTAHVARGVFSPKGDMYMSTPSTRRG